MSASNKQDDKTPEWDIFSRIEGLEEIALELMERDEETKPTLKNTTRVANDSLILSIWSFIYIFAHLYRNSPSDARRAKDTWIESYKKAELSNETLDSITSLMNKLCKGIENSHRK